MKNKVRIAIVGSGFAAQFHLASYRKIYRESFEVSVICSRNSACAGALAKTFNIPRHISEFDTLLRDPSIDLLDLCVPNHLHVPLILQAAAHGKHIVCEKPLGGYFGPPGADDTWTAVGFPRRTMLEAVNEQIQQVREAVVQSGVTFCYAENWVYAPPVVKLNRLMAASGSAIMRIEGEESHSGSHAAYARRWRTSGGGSLLRLGAHPIGAAIHLKHEEGRRRHRKPIRPVSVIAQVANLTGMSSFQLEEPKHFVTDWEDVEDWASIILAFEDGSVAQLTSTDTRLGGIRDTLSAFSSRAVVTANINPNTTCQAYTPDGRYFESEHLVEKAETKEGWSFPAPDEDAITGYPDELRDFIDAVANQRRPRSDLMLAADVLNVVYAGYCSAQSGERVRLSAYL